MIVIKTKVIMLAAAIWLVFAAGVHAAQLSAKMDYETYTAELTYTSELDYPSYVTVVMTDSEVTEPEISDYLQLGESPCGAKSSATVSIKIDRNIADGDYKFFAVAGGGSKADTTLKIISQTSVDDIIKKINESAQNGISGIIYNELKDTLELTDNASVQMDSYLYNIRQSDYSGAFKDMNQIRDAWELSKTLNSLANTQAAEIPVLLEKHSDMLKLNLADEDYKKQTGEVSRILKVMASDIKSLGELQKKYQEAVAVAMINKSGVNDKDSYFEKYKQVLGIESLMTSYKKLDAMKFARQFDGLALNSAQEVYSKFDSTIKSMSSSQSNTSNSSGSHSSSGSGSSGFNLSGAPAVSIPNTTPVAPETEFTDLNSSHWAYESVKALKNLNVVSGYSDGSFMPEKEVAREEFVTMIVLAFGFEKNENAPEFTDVSESDWYSGYVNAAASNDIVSGLGDGSFGAGKSITRQESAVILDRIMISLAAKQDTEISELNFADSEQIASWAAQSVARLSSEGIISGIDGNFAPDLPVTRAQAARLIYGCMQNISRSGVK